MLVIIPSCLQIMGNREVIILNVIICLWYDNHWIQDIRHDGWPLILRISKMQMAWLVLAPPRLAKIKPQWTVQASGSPATGWPQVTQNSQEALPPLKVPEVTSGFPFVDSLYLERFSGVLTGHHCCNVCDSVNSLRRSHWDGRHRVSCGRVFFPNM